MPDPESRRAKARPQKKKETLLRRQKWMRMGIAVLIIFLMVFSSFIVLFR